MAWVQTWKSSSHLSILSETWPSHFGAIYTFTLFPLEMWLFLHSFCTWKSDSQCLPSSLGESVSSFSLSHPLELASAGTSGLLNPPLALKYNYRFLLDFFLSKCNLKTLEKQKLYCILPRVPKKLINKQQQDPTAILSGNTFSFEGASCVLNWKCLIIPHKFGWSFPLHYLRGKTTCWANE